MYIFINLPHSAHISLVLNLGIVYLNSLIIVTEENILLRIGMLVINSHEYSHKYAHIIICNHDLVTG